MADAGAKNTRAVQPGGVVFFEGDLGAEMYIVRTGQLEVVRKMGDGEVVLATLGPSQFFGEMALFDGHPHIATVTAIEDTEVSAMARDQFENLIASMDPVMKGIVAMLVSRLRQTVDELVPKAGDVNWADWRK